MLHQLRQPRYLALGAVMLLVAAVCCAAGAWQVARLLEKHHANQQLRHNAHLGAADVSAVLAATTRSDAGARAKAAQFRHVSAVGTYLSDADLAVRERTVDGTVGFLVLTPFRTDAGTILLVVRGFVAADANRPTAIAAAPTRSVHITGRVQPPETRDDRFGRTAPGQVSAINPEQAARRLAAPVYSGYVELLPSQPGSAGLTPIPAPDLSNPAGGAVEPQHVAYILQWFLFALLALAAPFVMARADSRAPESDDVDLATGAPLPAPEAGPPPDPVADARSAKLADRYGTSRRR